jgi:hypothetical protein
MKHLYIAFLALVGAVVYRIRGGLSPWMPRPVDQLIFALPYAVIAAKEHNRSTWWFFGVLIITTIALMPGHGQYMDLGTWNAPVDPERLDFIVQLFFGDDNYNNYWRDFFGLAVTGLVVTLPAAISLYKKPVLAILLFLSGALKAVAYGLSWYLGFETEGGEYLTGLFLWLSAGYVYTKV